MIEALGLAHVSGSDQHAHLRSFAADAFDQLPELCPRQRIDAGGGFVEDQLLLGTQLPYIGLGMFNFATLALLAVFVFGIPIKGSLLTLCLGALLYIVCATGLGLLMSSI